MGNKIMSKLVQAEPNSVTAIVKQRGPRMGRWIRRRWICIWGAPIFIGFWKIGAPQKGSSNDDGSKAPFTALSRDS